ncbi:MAG: DinB family protein [Gemmatimonadota bacterium]|nr:MAG: DinB family protein [Gemmatimonadota bacterium]
MELALKDVFAILESTPETLRALLGNLPDHWLTCTEGPQSFSPRDVLGHLLHGEETDWMPRVKMVLEHGESVAFEPFDRFAFRKKYKGKTIEALLDDFEARRIRNLEELTQLDLSPEQLQLTGTHPELGRVTLAQLLATWTVHDLAHINQITRVMARQYVNEVGPWREYVRLLAG